MTKAQPLYSVSNPDDTAPEELLEVDVKNHGLYAEVSDRLHLLQDWVRRRVAVP